MVARRAPGPTEAIYKKIGAQAFECPVCPGVEETGAHVVLDCPQHQHVWATACAKATDAEGISGTPAEQGWRALGLEGQKAHLLSSEGVFPPEVERRLSGVATKAPVDGFHEVDVGLNLGHAALREKISAEVQQMAPIKEAAKAAAKAAAKEAGAQGPASCGQAPQGMPVAQAAAIPAQDGQGSQQDALQESRDPTEGVPPAGKAGPQPKVQRAPPSAVAAAAVKAKALERKRTKKPRKKKTL